jgi:hypothetical protein
LLYVAKLIILDRIREMGICSSSPAPFLPPTFHQRDDNHEPSGKALQSVPGILGSIIMP